MIKSSSTKSKGNAIINRCDRIREVVTEIEGHLWYPDQQGHKYTFTYLEFALSFLFVMTKSDGNTQL